MQVRDLSNHAGFKVLLDQAFHSEKDGELGHGAETGGADLHWVGLNPECRAQLFPNATGILHLMVT